MIKKLILLSIVIVFSGMLIIDAYAEKIPDWVKNNFEWFAQDLISEDEIISALQFLINNDIIIIDSATRAADIITENKSDAGSTDVPVTVHDKVDYTILVYVVGSDLESKYYLASADFKEMIQGNPNDSVNLIIQSGGSKAEPNDKSVIDFTTNKRLQVKDGKITELVDLGKKNMGLSSTLSDFIVWGTQSFPAEKYALVLWNHGSGINGFGLDLIFRDKLDLDELKDAFEDAKNRNDVHFELVGFDACLMATLEVANILKDYSNYLVASEEFEVGYGWKYDDVIASLNKDSKQTGDQLGKVIADSFYADTVAKSTARGDLSRITTLSVIDLSKISTLNDSINALTADIEENISEKDMPKFSLSLGDSERYGIVKGKDSGHMDIENFAEKIPKHMPQFKSLADKVKSDVEDAVVYAVQGAARPNAYGLSLYMPLTSDAVATNYRYGDVFSANQFYADYLSRDKTAPTQNITHNGTLITGTYEGDDVYELLVYFTTGLEDSGIVKIVSSDEFEPGEAEFGSTYGEINYFWDGYLPSICSEFECVPVFVEWVWGDTANLGYIPVLIENDQGLIEADLLYDVGNEENDWAATFIGVYPQAEEGVFEKNMLTLENGDKIYPYIKIIHWDTDTSMLVPENNHAITVDDYFFTSGFWQTFDGPFYLNVLVCDFSDNCSTSDFFEIQVDGDYQFFK